MVGNDKLTCALSVIIPTRNRALLLGATISSLTYQTLESNDWELIIVDNNSSDHTSTIAKSFSHVIENLKYVLEPVPGLHAARHRGATEASGEVLVFIDDDIEVTPFWALAIYKNFLDNSLAMVGGNNLPVFYGSVPPWLTNLWSVVNEDGSRSIPWLSIQENRPGKRVMSPYKVWGCNFSIRRDVLMAAGGFHPDGMPDELVRFRGDGETHVSRYVSENKLKCIFDSDASVFHKVTPERMTLEYFRKRGFRQGISDSYTELRQNSAKSQIRKSSKAETHFTRIKDQARRLKHMVRGNSGKRLPYQYFDDGYRAGYAYHQEVYAVDPEVRAWVHKEDYF